MCVERRGGCRNITASGSPSNTHVYPAVRYRPHRQHVRKARRECAFFMCYYLRVFCVFERVVVQLPSRYCCGVL